MPEHLQTAFSRFCHTYAKMKGYNYRLGGNECAFAGMGGSKPFTFTILRSHDEDAAPTYTMVTRDTFGESNSFTGGGLSWNYVPAETLCQCLTFATSVLLAG